MRSRAGFTLLELLLALLLITGGLFPLLSAIGTSLRSAAESKGSVIASNLAQAKMEEIKNTAFDNLINQTRAAVPGYPGYSQEAQVTTALNDLKNIKVIVYWQTTGAEKNLTLETLIVK